MMGLLLLASATNAAPPGVRNSAATELTAANRMIASMIGEWSGVMSANVPPNTEDVPWRISCEPIGRDAGISCRSGGTASIGRLDQSCLLAAAPVSHEIHLMCVSSMGEVHDHRGRYEDGWLTFEPLRSWIGKDMVEELVKYQIAADGTMRTSSVVLRQGQPTMRFTLTAHRIVGASPTGSQAPQ
jgi:hypothetical protein